MFTNRKICSIITSIKKQMETPPRRCRVKARLQCERKEEIYGLQTETARTVRSPF